MSVVLLQSQIPHDHHAKNAVERAFTRILGDEPESWTVVLEVQPEHCWTLFLMREDGFRRVFLLDEQWQQSGTVVNLLVTVALGQARMAANRTALSNRVEG
jgi:hypothetical protein